MELMICRQTVGWVRKASLWGGGCTPSGAHSSCGSGALQALGVHTLLCLFCPHIPPLWTQAWGGNGHLQTHENDEILL